LTADGKSYVNPDSAPIAEWKTWSWRQYHDDVRAAAKGFLSLGALRYDGIAILGHNSPEWFMAEMAAMYFGGKAAGIYPTDTAEQIQFKSLLSDSSVAVVDTVAAFQKFRAVAKSLPFLKGIVVWGEAPPVDSIDGASGKVECMSWQTLLQRGRELAGGDAALDAAAAVVQPGNCAALVFTSGTTGNPKAVMVSHDNLIFEAACAIGHHVTAFGANAGEQERILSYLPLSHVAGMMVDIIAPLVCTSIKPGYGTVYFSRPMDLKSGALKQRLLAVRPTIFLGVPRVWEKFMEGMQAVGAKMPDGLKKTIVGWAKRTMLAYQKNLQVGGSGVAPLGVGIARKLLVKAKQAIGLEHCKFFLTGAAPISKETLEYFASIGISINEVYGMSECCGATTISTDPEHRWGSIGFSMAGCETRVFRVAEGGGGGKLMESKQSRTNGHLTEEEQGEICFRGRHIMMGYLMNPRLGQQHVDEMKKKNQESIDAEGWLHSGDKASRDTSNMFKITGRYKELIIGAGGENIAPVPIEAGLKRAHGAISNCVMVGDKRKFNVVLITLKAVGATGERAGGNDLEQASMVHCSAGVTTISQAMDDEALIKSIEAAVVATNKNGDVCPSQASHMQKFTILPIDISVETGDITPSLKLKRSELEAKYKKLLDRMYAPENEKVNYVRYQASDTAHLSLLPPK